MSISLPNNKLFEIQLLALSLLQTQPVTVHHVMSFQARPILVPIDSAFCVMLFRMKY